jgi:RNAse (barnase) inhibitor barstar
MGKINFTGNPSHYSRDGVFSAHIYNAHGKKELLIQLSDKLSFPSFFGFNWDALFDVLRDFSWIEQKTIVLIHDDMPQLKEQEMKIYLEILADAAQDWKKGENHDLEIIFPESDKTKIQQILNAPYQYYNT